MKKEAKPATKAKSSYTMLLMGMLLILLNFVMIAFIEFEPIHKEVVYVGYSFWLCGLVFWIVPTIQLSKKSKDNTNYMETKELVSSGLYSIIRHPQYFGFVMFAFGFILKAQHWIVASSSLLGIVLIVLGCRKEDKQLLQIFGDDYKQYMKQVSGLNPFKSLLKRKV